MRLITCLFVLGACTGSSAIDAGVDASCGQLRAEYVAAVAGMDRSCAVTTDCAMAGAESYYLGDWCNGCQYLGGVGVNRAAYEGSAAAAAEKRFHDQCARLRGTDAGCIADYAQPGLVCNTAGHCETYYQCGCGWTCADAGVPDATAADAP